MGVSFFVRCFTYRMKASRNARNEGDRNHARRALKQDAHPTSHARSNRPIMQIRIAGLFATKSREASVRNLLSADDMDLMPVASIAPLLAMLRDSEVDAVLVEDAGPAVADWLGVLQLRAAGTVPVIVVGTPAGLGMADALLLGATDYIDHDASPDQLATRLRAHVGTQRSRRQQDLEVGPFLLCTTTSTVTCEGTEISLTAREFALAWALFSRVGRIVPLASLSAHVWGRSSDVCKRTLEQHIYKLRRKLGGAGTGLLLRIQAVYGVGYRLDVLSLPGTAAHAAAADGWGAQVNPLQRSWAGA
jgi:DNA-binding response OmpR family regulator